MRAKRNMAFHETTVPEWHNPVGVVDPGRLDPRVASQARQPWALRWNPFGIRGLRFMVPMDARKRNEALRELLGWRMRQAANVPAANESYLKCQNDCELPDESRIPRKKAVQSGTFIAFHGGKQFV